VKLLIVYNSHAGHGNAKKLMPAVKKYFNEKQIEYEMIFTEYAGHGIEITREAVFDNYSGLIAAGGDGTLFEVINGYYQNKSNARIPIGVLPIGTGNAFARDLDLHVSKWQAAIDIIVHNKTIKSDVGYFKTDGKDFYYLNILGFGFVADVTETAHKLKIIGNLSYTLGVLYQTLMLNTNQLSIEIDGQKLERENIFVEISNTRYTANFLMAPNAKIDDGKLDVTLVGKVSRRRLLQVFPKVFTGEHIHLPEVETFQAEEIRIKTDVPKILTPDGELLGSTPIEVKCLKQAIDVFWKT